MENNKKDKKKDEKDAAVVRGKKAIDASKKALGEKKSDPKTKNKEKRDARQWRNEG